jgi:hypothetical protein
MTDQNMDSVNEFGVSRKQETIDTLWVKYRKTLEILNETLDNNESIKAELDNALLENKRLSADLDQHKIELDKKPKEVEVIKEVEKEVEKIIEVEAKIDLSVPSDIAELEKKLENRLQK